MRFKGCLIAFAVSLAVVAALVGVFGPGLAREAARFYTPISKLKATQNEFETWAEQHPWQEPAAPQLGAERLGVFLKLRKDLQKLESQIEIPQPGARADKPKLRDMPGIVQGIGGVVSGQLAAYQGAGMTPKEYHYLERLIYRRWLAALRREGADPAARQRAAEEIEQAARDEREAAVKARLRERAKQLRDKRPPPPEGVPDAIHVLLLEHAQEVQALSESTAPFPMRAR